MSTALDLIDASRADQLIDNIDAQFTCLGIDTRAPLSRKHAEEIWEHQPEAKKAVQRYLTHMERLAAAIRLGAVDTDLAYHFCVGDVVEAYARFEEFIELKREKAKERHRSDEEILIHFEELARTWKVEKLRKQGFKPLSGRKTNDSPVIPKRL